MVYLVASTAGALEEELKRIAAEERELPLERNGFPLVHIVKESKISRPERSSVSDAFEVTFGDERTPHTPFSVRIISYDEKTYVFAFSRLGVQVKSVTEKEGKIIISQEKEFLFPKEQDKKRMTRRGKLEVQKEGRDLGVYVATYHDNATDPDWDGETPQFESGNLFKALMKRKSSGFLEPEKSKKVRKQETAETEEQEEGQEERIKTHGVIVGTRNVYDTDKRLFIGNMTYEGETSLRTFIAAVNGEDIARTGGHQTIIGYDRYLDVRYSGRYFGYTDSRAHFYLHLRNEEGLYSYDEPYPFIGKTPSFGTLDDRVLAVSLPLPASSLIFVENHNGKDYVVFGLWNSRKYEPNIHGGGRLLVFEINSGLTDRAKEKGEAIKIKTIHKDARELTDYLTLCADVTVLDTASPSEQTSVQNLKSIGILGKPVLYFSIGRTAYALQFEDLLAGKREKIATIKEFSQDILSMDVLL